MYAITSHKRRRAKYQTEMLSRIAKQQFRYKQCFQQNNTLTVDTNGQKFNCDNADGHSQTGNHKKKMSASWIRKTSRKNKGNEKRLKTLFTHRWSNSYLHKLTFIVDLTDSHGLFKSSASELTTSAISMMQNTVRTFLLTFRRKVSSELCESMKISWRVVNCYCILNLHSSGISCKN